ncbi:MAG: DUF4250 domain-containing protein [Bacteroidales bacterium]|nr:DUF4250 domain-containing protein [Bacteroidales bacterium]
MDHLLKDPYMLVSSINMLLRDDEFESLDSLCNSFDCAESEIIDYLAKYDFVYSSEQKQFRPSGYNA